MIVARLIVTASNAKACSKDIWITSMPNNNATQKPRGKGKMVFFKPNWWEIGYTCGDFAGYHEFPGPGKPMIINDNDKIRDEGMFRFYGEGYRHEDFRTGYDKGYDAGRAYKKKVYEQENPTILLAFMRELCRREYNENPDMKTNPLGIVFPTQEIQQAVLGRFSLERVKYALRENALTETKDNGLFEFLGDDRKVRLTNVGRAWCQQHGVPLTTGTGTSTTSSTSTTDTSISRSS